MSYMPPAAGYIEWVPDSSWSYSEYDPEKVSRANVRTRVLSTPKSSTPHRVSQCGTLEEYSVYPVRHRERKGRML